MSAEVAMEQYITLLSESVPWWMQDVHGDFADPQVHETVTTYLDTLIQNQSNAAGVRINRLCELSFFNKVRVSGIPDYLQFLGCDCRHLGDDIVHKSSAAGIKCR
ncbi:uncharacterized protein LOC112175414 [Rosa chinensis]|uniref:uncharacterized protein LOC112175414 n=1 Tax=Rosa chinensis TaxID=74649 RepID=UPI000D093C61|nr:uncharacterized protein LOC112175414 [Rosa chinensis]XP_024168857.1 uncharacterized protein LOC112175414 [Rosa chinensis]XP_024168858.1 uncharacterized protein LOC112175414 [Rosa chinensis]XP_024168859.1 uncharacterized protein LOC112175414 [Rosa chinensis]XP_024168860.1 uncharacterized protein LOC112175414 [Rosa chinensis]